MSCPDLTITSLETLTAFDIATGSLKFILDELQNATIANTQEKNDITGKGGRKLGSIKRNKGVTISGTNGMLSAGLMEAQTGSAFVNGETTVMRPDYLTVKDNAATTSYKAVGTTGNEISEVLVKDAGGTVVERLTQSSAAAEGKFAYNPTSKVLTFNEGDIADGTEIIACYKRKMIADVLENMSDVYSSKCELYLDAIGEDKCANVYRVQFHLPKADFSGEFSLEFGENQAVHAFEAESLAGACGAGGSLWSYTVFGVKTEDVA